MCRKSAADGQTASNRILIEELVFQIVRLVASSQFAVFDHLLGSDFEIVRLAEERKEVDKAGGDVVLEAELTGVVRPREGVMEVVEAFADCAENGCQIFGWRNAVIVRAVAPHVCCTVDQPGVRSKKNQS